MRKALVAAVMLCGCGQPPAERVVRRDVCGYYTVELRPAGSLDFACLNSGPGPVRAIVNGRELRIAEGALTLEGVDRGTVKKGDVIALAEDGALTVNGDAR